MVKGPCMHKYLIKGWQTGSQCLQCHLWCSAGRCHSAPQGNSDQRRDKGSCSGELFQVKRWEPRQGSNRDHKCQTTAMQGMIEKTVISGISRLGKRWLRSRRALQAVSGTVHCPSSTSRKGHQEWGVSSVQTELCGFSCSVYKACTKPQEKFTSVGNCWIDKLN